TGLAEALQPVPQQNGLMLLASGPIPPNPSELLSSQRAADVMRALRTQADFVVVDCPPALPVTDAAVLSVNADACLLVVMAGITAKRELGRSVEVLRQVEAPLTGLVMNAVPADGAYGYGYDYRYYSQRGDGNGHRVPRARE